MAAAAILKNIKMPCLSRGFSNFDEFWHVAQFDPLDRSDSYKFLKSKMAAAAILKIQNSRYLGNGLTNRREIWHEYAY